MDWQLRLSHNIRNRRRLLNHILSTASIISESTISHAVGITYKSNRYRVKHSFGGLKETIKSGNAVEGFYEHEKLRNRLYIWRPIKHEEDLEAISGALRIKVPIFDVK